MPNKGSFKKGKDPRRNMDGRPVGTNNFETDFNEAVDEIAKENNMTRSEARKLLLKVAFKQAKDGNYSFYKDIHDRLYGQATQKHELVADVQINEKAKQKADEAINTFLNGNNPNNSTRGEYTGV